MNKLKWFGTLGGIAIYICCVIEFGWKLALILFLLEWCKNIETYFERRKIIQGIEQMLNFEINKLKIKK